MMRFLAVVIFSSLCNSAFAQPYVFLGVSNLKEEDEGASFIAPGVGWRFGKVFAVEAALAKPEEVRRGGSASVAGATTTNVHDSYELDGFRVSALAHVYFKDFSLFGRLSAYRFEGDFRSDTDTTTGGSTTTVSTSSAGSGTVPALGIGLAYDFTPKLQVRLLYERIRGKSGVFGEGRDLEDMTTTTFDVVYTF